MAKNLVNKNRKFRIHTYRITVLCCLLIACSESKSETSSTTDLDNHNDSIKALNEINESDDYQLVIDFKDDFIEAKRDSVELWVRNIFTATETVLGEYPFDTYVNVFPASGRQPVPFGLASRKNGINQVKLYVNENATFKELMEDWTAPHELSHLALPFVGRSNKWFSEGFATYCSRRIMIELGYHTDSSFEALYTRKVEEFRPYFNSSTSTFSEVADSLLSNNRYSPIYWGGSTFFMIMDSRLQNEKEWRFTDLIDAYQSNGRLTDKNLKEVIASFDLILNDSWCRELLVTYRNEPSVNAMKLYDER